MTAARVQALKLRYGIDQGDYPLEERREEFAAPTMRALANDYLERHSKIHKRSYMADRQILNTAILPALGSERVHAVTCRDVFAAGVGVLRATIRNHQRGVLMKWEFPRLCRGGTRSLTNPGVHPRNS